MIKFATITPHPPIIIPSIGKSATPKAQATIEAMRKLRISLNRLKGIDSIFVISPHLPSTWDAFTLFYKDPYDKTLKGDFSDFGDAETAFEFLDNKKTAEQLKVLSGPTFSLMGVTIRHLDHGTLVPLYYLWGEGKHKIPLLPMAFCSLPLQEHFKFGKFLGEFFRRDNKNWAIVASGDLSHRLAPSSPAGYHPQAKRFDHLLIESLKQQDTNKILNIKPALVEAAGECGLRSIVILLGIIAGMNWDFRFLSYEAPFGVGYLVSEILLQK